MAENTHWNTRSGMYLAAMGTAFGLGNLWRFPYIVSENGGGAFIFVYLLVAATVGLPMLIGELILGKQTGKSLLSALASVLNLDDKKTSHYRFYKILSYLPIILSVVVMAYYTVLSGWVLCFAFQFLLGIIQSIFISQGADLYFPMKNDLLQLFLVTIHLLLASTVVAKGFKNGLERFLVYLSPVFIVMIFILIIHSFSLPSVQPALHFLFYPDFSQITFRTLGNAVGHVLFTLSLGFGMMVTFGSYMHDSDNVPAVGFRVASMDTVVSLMAGLLIFPIIFAFDATITGPTTFFETIPIYFSGLRWGQAFGFIFFSCLYLTSLGASITLLQTIVTNTTERKGVPRRTALCWVMGVAFLLAGVFAFSNFLNEQVGGQLNLLVLADRVFVNWILPIGALSISSIVAYKMGDKGKRAFFDEQPSAGEGNLYADWSFFLRWLCPLFILAGLLMQVISLF